MGLSYLGFFSFLNLSVHISTFGKFLAIICFEYFFSPHSFFSPSGTPCQATARPRLRVTVIMKTQQATFRLSQLVTYMDREEKSKPRPCDPCATLQKRGWMSGMTIVRCPIAEGPLLDAWSWGGLESPMSHQACLRTAFQGARRASEALEHHRLEFREAHQVWSSCLGGLCSCA